MRSYIKKAFSIYRENGILHLFQAIRGHIEHRVGFTGLYQEQRSEGTEQRWEYIQPHLGDVSSILDVGCNAGKLTAKGATESDISIGIEPSTSAIQRAKDSFGDRDGVGYINMRITPENVSSLPACDVVFLLSVYHIWHSEYGAAEAKQMLSKLAKKADSALFFEAASRAERYNDEDMTFTDYEEKELVEFQTSLIDDALGKQWQTSYLGKSEVGDEADGFRCLFVVKKASEA